MSKFVVMVNPIRTGTGEKEADLARKVTAPEMPILETLKR